VKFEVGDRVRIKHVPSIHKVWRGLTGRLLEVDVVGRVLLDPTDRVDSRGEVIGAGQHLNLDFTYFEPVLNGLDLMLELL